MPHADPAASSEEAPDARHPGPPAVSRHYNEASGRADMHPAFQSIYQRLSSGGGYPGLARWLDHGRRRRRRPGIAAGRRGEGGSGRWHPVPCPALIRRKPSGPRPGPVISNSSRHFTGRAFDSRTPLRVRLREGRFPILRYVSALGCPIPDEVAEAAFVNGRIECAALLYERGSGITPLLRSAPLVAMRPDGLPAIEFLEKCLGRPTGLPQAWRAGEAIRNRSVAGIADALAPVRRRRPALPYSTSPSIPAS